MAGKSKGYSFDWIRLLLFAIIGLIALLFYAIIVQSSSNLVIFLYFTVGILIYFKRRTVRGWIYNKLLLRTKRILAYIPTVIWGGFAVFGIFIFGVFVGLAFQDPNEHKLEDNRISKYQDVIDSYQTLSKLFYLQGQDMDIITNSNSWENNPEEFSDAVSSYYQKRDEILFQFGKIYERRSRASLPDDPYIKTE